MRWQLRFLRNAVIGVLPLGVQRTARRVKRLFRPHRLVLEPWTLEQGLRQVAMLRSAGADPAGRDVLEIGTGWAPVIPLVFHFAGARSLTLVDLQRLMDDHTFRETCRQLVPHAEMIAARLGVAAGPVRATLQRLSRLSLEEGLAAVGGTYRAPLNLLGGTLASGRFGIITSRAVLEHIPPSVLTGVFRACARLLAEDGMMCHLIDNSDHWEHSDKRISRVNFLRYGRRLFWLLSALNPLDYQNRLRHPEYLRLIREAGFDIAYDASPPDPQALADLRRIRLAPMFRSFAHHDLAILSTSVVARKRTAPETTAAGAQASGDEGRCRATG